MLTFQRTDSSDAAFLALVRQLDAGLAVRNGEQNSFFAQYNKTDAIRHVIVAFDNDIAVGCGAIKAFDENAMEIKRMYTLPAYRGKGIAAQVVNALEEWTAALGYKKCVLETGTMLPEAIALYTKCGYTVIPNYGQYAGIESSVCFEKTVRQP